MVKFVVRLLCIGVYRSFVGELEFVLLVQLQQSSPTMEGKSAITWKNLNM